ncbi:hypothetical protein AGDE_06659 [Angomonas deanei]|uniref:Leucine Rich repeat, putative n=1 Tax=Angomonas deanei TaxID=59799 RepID=A0A7G2C7H3_9TRYP|nr:hypothetical protein AGDE_06659 [Angomonas deanei]CAD2215770.1 Leucine Rich repeat, putative [Angomonas deanei]|eukprot:EPY36953.1 hypothetical protein AGDE_06659 [Angomonas deanei]
MGASCCGGSSGTTNGVATGSSKRYAKGSTPPFTTKNNIITNGTKKHPDGTAMTGAPEENRARVKERAINSLTESMKSGDLVVPSLRWRRQYMKLNGIGLDVCKAVSEFLQKHSQRRNAGPSSVSGLERSMQQSDVSPDSSVNTNPVKSSNNSKNKEVLPLFDTLDLRSMRIGDEGLAALAPGLLADRMLRNVYLSNNNITNEGVQRFANILNDPTNKYKECKVSLFVFADNPISSDGIRVLCRALKHLTAVERLEIGKGRAHAVDEEGELLSPAAVESMIELVNEGPQTLQTLVLKGTGDYYNSTGFSPEGMKDFVNAVVGGSNLSQLYLQECYTTKPGSSGGLAATVFHRNSTTSAPNSVVNRAEQVDMQALISPIHALATSLLSSSSCLETLVLRFPLSDEAVATLSHGIARAPHLVHLSLRGCDMSTKALTLLGNAIRSNTSLETLDISYQSAMIAHPLVLAELRSSSKRRQSISNGLLETSPTFSGYVSRHGGGIDGEDVPSREEREHALLPVIKAMHMNRHLVRLIMIGINIQTSDVEELCSCFEISHNRTLCEVAYTPTGSAALKMKLDNFLHVNQELYDRKQANAPPGASAVSARSGGLPYNASMGSLLGDPTDDNRSLSDSPRHGSPSRFSYSNANSGNNISSAASPNHLQTTSQGNALNNSLDEDIAGSARWSLPPMSGRPAAHDGLSMGSTVLNDETKVDNCDVTRSRMLESLSEDRAGYGYSNLDDTNLNLSQIDVKVDEENDGSAERVDAKGRPSITTEPYLSKNRRST